MCASEKTLFGSLVYQGCGLCRVRVIHLAASGKPEWQGYLDEGFYGCEAKAGVVSDGVLQLPQVLHAC